MQFNFVIPLWVYDLYLLRLYDYDYQWTHRCSRGEHVFCLGYTRAIFTPRGR